MREVAGKVCDVHADRFDVAIQGDDGKPFIMTIAVSDGIFPAVGDEIFISARDT